MAKSFHERSAEVVQFVPHLLHQFDTAHDGTGDDVVVAVQVLGGAVQREVVAVLGRTEIHRAGEGVVDH